ncbi:Putative TRAF4-associated factor 1 [Tupaia chinensis]|uniref:Putative TRAF4-associated factor 1 n=1 Tax=Tupaia chinensis TaxID=246437 RepID=L9L4J0_TUPCH|nr:Putative TRAF4-associated factor 1 [Tupaia chinensis]
MMTSGVKTVYSLQTPSMPSGGLQTHKLEPILSLLPVRTKEVDVPRRLHSGGSENAVTKTAKLRQENGQVKAADTANRRNVKKSYLHQKLTETQGELKDLTQKVELLEKFQNNCLALLENKGLNPVLDSESLTSQQESTMDHTSSMLLLETLQDELKLFQETAKKQMEELQALKVKLKMIEEERAQFLEQQSLHSGQVNDFTAALMEMEQLLEM